MDTAILAIWKDWESLDVPGALVVSLIAICVVFLVLVLLILITTIVQKSLEGVDSVTRIMPREENKILDEDKDAAVAALVASIEFNKETGKDANIVSITKMED